MAFWEEWQNKKYQESVSPYRQQPWPNLSGVTILKFQSLLKACKTQEKAWTVNCGLLQSISALGTVVATHLPLRQHARVPRAACTQLVGTRLGKTNLFFQSLGICVLTVDCCFWSYRCIDKVMVATFVSLPPISDSSSPSSGSDSPGDLKAHCPHPISFSFSLSGSQLLKTFSN